MLQFHAAVDQFGSGLETANLVVDDPGVLLPEKLDGVFGSLVQVQLQLPHLLASRDRVLLLALALEQLLNQSQGEMRRKMG